MSRTFRASRPFVSSLAAVTAAIAALSCSDATEPTPAPDPWPRSPNTDHIASLDVRAPDRLELRELGLIEVTARGDDGQVVAMPWLPVFTSSDSTVAAVSFDGVVRGADVGEAVIRVTLGDATAVVDVEVWARMRIGPELVFPLPRWPMAIGDTFRLEALYVDVDGNPVRAVPSPSWTSDVPDVATVDANGTVTGHAYGVAHIVASAGDVEAETTLDVFDVQAGLPATARFAHVAPGVGPVTFTPSKGEPLVLSYGESVTLTVPSGLYVVRTTGLSNADPMFRVRNDYAGVIEPDDGISYFAVGRPDLGFLAASWSQRDPPPAGQSWVRLVQGWNEIGIFYLREADAPMSGLPELCYFDPGDVSNSFARPAGAFDIILEEKYGGPGEFARFRADAPADDAVTYVLVGAAAGDAQFLAFPDP